MTHLGIGESQWTLLLKYHHHLWFAKWKAFWSSVGVRDSPLVTDGEQAFSKAVSVLTWAPVHHVAQEHEIKLQALWFPLPQASPSFLVLWPDHTARYCSGRPGIYELFSHVNWWAYCSNHISPWFWITSKHEPQMDNFQLKVRFTCIMEEDSTLMRPWTSEDCMTVWGDDEKIDFSDCPIYKSNWVLL